MSSYFADLYEVN